jgi:hypothetical protein
MRQTELSFVCFAAFAQITAASQCTLCGDESIPDGALSHEQDGVSCRSLFDDLAIAEEESEECKRIQLASFQTGCCSDQFIPDNVCSLCPDGTPFRTGVRIPGSPGRRELTCADLPSEGSFLDFFTTPGDCSDTFLQRSAGWCECPGHKVECHLCPGGRQPPNPYKTENVLYGWDCQSFQYVTALLSSAECPVAGQLLEFDAAAFCCPEVAPPEVCSFCPETQVVRDPEKVVPTEYGMLKCGDIDSSLSLVPTESSCAFAKKSFDSDLCCAQDTSGSVTVAPQLVQMMAVISAGAFFFF